MDIEGFLRACAEQWGTTDGEALAVVAHPADRRLAGLRDRIPGFATENKLMLLNLAVRHLDPGEVYVEVGTWQGLSVVGAARGNEDKRLVVCDDFSKMGASRQDLDDHLAAYFGDGEVEVHEGDFGDFLRLAPWRPARVGAYFYDGAHGFRDQLDALRLIRRWLAPDAVIIIDDTEDRPVRAANDLFSEHVPALEPLLDIPSDRYKDPRWWNGVQVFRWRADAAPPDLPIPRRRYIPRRLLWNRVVVYGQRAAHYLRQLRDGR